MFFVGEQTVEKTEMPSSGTHKKYAISSFLSFYLLGLLSNDNNRPTDDKIFNIRTVSITT